MRFPELNGWDNTYCRVLHNTELRGATDQTDFYGELSRSFNPGGHCCVCVVRRLDCIWCTHDLSFFSSLYWWSECDYDSGEWGLPCAPLLCITPTHPILCPLCGLPLCGNCMIPLSCQPLQIMTQEKRVFPAYTWHFHVEVASVIYYMKSQVRL